MNLKSIKEDIELKNLETNTMNIITVPTIYRGLDKLYKLVNIIFVSFSCYFPLLYFYCVRNLMVNKVAYIRLITSIIWGLVVTPVDCSRHVVRRRQRIGRRHKNSLALSQSTLVYAAMNDD